jgi:hypothetical protein
VKRSLQIRGRRQLNASSTSSAHCPKLLRLWSWPARCGGTAVTSFETEKPFTIGTVSDAGTSDPAQEPDSARPSITAESDSIDRAGDPPRFRVDTGDHDHFIVEVAADASLFADRPEANTTEFYATYYDEDRPNRETGRSFTLPEYAWQALKAADRLYYRIGTTSSDSTWDDYTLSTEDDGQAPSFAITGADGRVPPRGGVKVPKSKTGSPRYGAPPAYVEAPPPSPWVHGSETPNEAVRVVKERRSNSRSYTPA